MKMTNPTESKIPNSYRPAKWRNTLPADKDEIGIGFDSEGKVIRLRLSFESAKHLSETIAEELEAWEYRETSKVEGSPNLGFDNIVIRDYAFSPKLIKAVSENLRSLQ